ncbi:uncharacterized protein [Rutidosis leptorrhynchoides]|uniref:uncharacterized protein n=1 Tax=Rutidosis leptorrhynchoides TaxID=125765 RepID=UPI003A9A0D87
MKIISLNIRGFGMGSDSKFEWVKSICASEKPYFLALQGTKCHKSCDNWFYSLWGSNSCKWKPTGADLMVTNIYGPHYDQGKRRMWDSLDNLLAAISEDELVFSGDFNEVRELSKRLNCIYMDYRARHFNEFIADNHLIEIPLCGRKFTRISDDGIKMSKLDRFLVSEKFCNSWEDQSVVALERRDSDHRPLVLRDKFINFGLKPIKVFDAWLNLDGAETVKGDLKTWSHESLGHLEEEIEYFKNKASDYELKAEQSGLSDIDRLQWMDTRKKWFEKERIKGDENSRYFQAAIRRRYNKSSIRGININGLWCDEPHEIKEAAVQHFKEIFGCRNSHRPSLVDIEYQKLHKDEAKSLEVPLSEKKVFDAMNECGSSKLPGPMGSVSNDRRVNSYLVNF